jgi:tetraacyldisaccharide 4'-kinase
VQALLAAHPCDVIISDDGLQHYALQRDYEIVVVDGGRGFGNQYLLPAGPLRESVARLQSVNHVVCNDSVVILPLKSIPCSLMRLSPDSINALNNHHTMAVKDWHSSKRVHAIAGIGNPQRFFNTLKTLGFELIEHRFSDHHNFSENDLAFNDDLPIIMTEKDAVKIRCLNFSSVCWYLPVSAHIDGDLLTDVVASIKQSPLQTRSPNEF